MSELTRITRRQAVAVGGAAIAALAVRDPAAAAGSLPGPQPVDVGTTAAEGVRFPLETAATDPDPGQPPNPTPRDERIGFAVVGLGRLALELILPAFASATHARLVALVSGSPDKAHAVAAQYGVRPDAVYDYANFDRMRDNPEIRVVYIVLPNALHREFVERSVRAGKDVLCEKPMATSVGDAEAMVEAARSAKRTLMIAYRCQYELVTRDLQAAVRANTYGKTRLIEATNVQDMSDPTQWRLRRALSGGGSLPDVGIYCFNAARALTGEEPTEVSAATYSPPGDPRFTQVEETVQWRMRFPSGVIASCTSSYGMHQSRTLSVHTTDAALHIDNAFDYKGQRLTVARRDGAIETVTERKVEAKDQFALEMDHMASCVRTGRRPRTPGEEGLADQRLMEAIYRSAASGRPIDLPRIEGLDTTRGPEPEKE